MQLNKSDRYVVIIYFRAQNIAKRLMAYDDAYTIYRKDERHVHQCPKSSECMQNFSSYLMLHDIVRALMRSAK